MACSTPATSLDPYRVTGLHAGGALTAAPVPTITSDDMVDVKLLAAHNVFDHMPLRYILMNAKKTFLFLFSLRFYTKKKQDMLICTRL
jgi:hypothetical protein